MVHDSQNKTRLLARLVREALATKTFETLADLTDTVKTRAAKLKIAVDAEAVNGAYTLIASNTPLLKPARTDFPAVTGEPAPLSQVDTVLCLQRLGVSVRGGRIQTAALAPLGGDGPENFPRLVQAN